VKGGRNGHVGLVFESRLVGPTPKGVGSQFFRGVRAHVGGTPTNSLEDTAWKGCRRGRPGVGRV
jgi:hypothetical protein